MLNSKMHNFYLLTIFLWAITISQLTFANESIDFNLIYEGEMPPEIRQMGVRAKAFYLADELQDYLLSNCDTYFSIYQFENGEWLIRNRIELDSADFEFFHWTTGDLDNDRNDELLLLKGKSISIYGVDGDDFTRTAHEFSYYPEDALIGDVDNNGFNELLMLCANEPKTYERIHCPYNLRVFGYKKHKLDLKWLDNGNLKLSDSGIVPASRLMCIGDIDNTGYYKLVIKGHQSDVSPTFYRLLHWHNNSLVRYKVFGLTELSDTLVARDRKSYRKPKSREERNKYKRAATPSQYAHGEIDPVLIKDKTYLLGQIFDNWLFDVVIKIVGNNSTIDRLAYMKDYGKRTFGKLQWLNIDGLGIGIIQTYYSNNDDELHFRFYR